MSTMDRREFMRKTAAAVGTTLGAQVLACTKVEKGPSAVATRPAAGKVLRATDVVTLGKTGI